MSTPTLETELRLSSTAWAAIRAHAEAGYPHEVVGVLAGNRQTGAVAEARPLRNERAETHNRYRVDPLGLLRAKQAVEREGLEVVGYYHSHPDHPARYSEHDREDALPNMSYLIVSVMNGQAVDRRSWRLREDRRAMDAEPVHPEDDPQSS